MNFRFLDLGFVPATLHRYADGHLLLQVMRSWVNSGLQPCKTMILAVGPTSGKICAKEELMSSIGCHESVAPRWGTINNFIIFPARGPEAGGNAESGHLRDRGQTSGTP